MIDQVATSQGIPNVGGCDVRGKERIDYAPDTTPEQVEQGEVLLEQWKIMTDEEQVSMVEQARLNQVATDYAVPLQQFAAAWAETGIEAVPESWDDALTLLGQSGTGADVFCRLLALRFGPLAPVWDDVLTLLNGGE